MKRVSRRFDLFLIGMSDVERMEAWESQDRVRFTYEQSLRLRRVRKRNTSLFDALADIAGQEYRVTDGVLECMLYETVLVDFHVNTRTEGYIRCGKPADAKRPHILPAEELKTAMYEHGFYITDSSGEEIHFVPFVASASMSREEEYLFVNSKRLDGLLRAVSLDMVSAGKEEYALSPVLNGEPLNLPDGAAFGALQENEEVASVPKLAAYMGLALSDGVSLRERWVAENGRELPELTEELWSQMWMLGLNDRNTVCVKEWVNADTNLGAFDYCWVNELAPREQSELKADKRGNPTEAQQRMGQLFAALRQPKAMKQEYINLMCEQGDEIIWAWRDAIDSLVAEPSRLQMELRRIPLPRSSTQGTSTYVYAIIYAMYLLKDEGEYIIARADAKRTTDGRLADVGEEDDSGKAAELLDIEMLKNDLNRLKTDENLRNRLWNLLHEENPPEYMMIGAKQAGETVRVTLCKRPAARYRAVLHRVDKWDNWDPLKYGNLYDGCGFLDDSAFEMLDKMLRGDSRPADEQPLNAVQIRLPWCKGLLVRFSAAEFFKLWAEERGCAVENLKIVDAFGATRNVLDAEGKPVLKAVFTTSMFKGFKWFDKLTDRTPEGSGDRWAEYWRRMWSHRVSLLIAGKSTPPVTTSRLNYQFLTTMGLNDKDLYRFVSQHLHQLGEAQHIANEFLAGKNKSQDELARVAKLLMGQMDNDDDEGANIDDILENAEDNAGGNADSVSAENDQDDPEDAGADEELAGTETAAEGEEPVDGEAAEKGGAYVTKLIRAMEESPEILVDTTIVRNRFTSLVQSELLHMMRGRLPVKGDVRYLVPDLLAMTRYIAKTFLRDGAGNAFSIPDDLEADARKCASVDDIGRTTLMWEAIDKNDQNPYGRYYAPGTNVPWPANARGERPAVTVLRNPHYAMGEEPVLDALTANDWKVYDSWFGKLTGCVMTSQAVMFTINGADCDGDRVNVCAEPCVVEGIRNRAMLETRLLKTLYERKDEVEAFLEDPLSCAGAHEDVGKYLNLLKQELPEILWRISPDTAKRRNYLPPLIYAGSASKGKSFSRREMMGGRLKEQMWKTFCMASQQSIGKMSLDVLRMTADAYGYMGQSEDLKHLPVKTLLGRFVARYLVVCKALDTAMEIDMAKTGATCDKHEIKTVPPQARSYFGLGQKSGYYVWRSLFKKYKKRLKGYGFDYAMRKMMEAFNEKKTKAEQSPLALDRLPIMVYRLWAPEQAKKINEDWTPQKYERADLMMIRAGKVLDHKMVPVRKRLQKPDEKLIEQLETPDKAKIALLSRIEALVEHYDRERRKNKAAQEAAEHVDKAYHSVMEWLLRNGRGLDDAHRDMRCIRSMLDRWYGTPKLNIQRLRDTIVCLQDELEKQTTAVRWGWSDKPKRIGMLQDALKRACGKSGALTAKEGEGRIPAIVFQEGECDLLACGRRSLTLVQRVMDFAWYDAALHMRSILGNSMSMDELEGRIKGNILAAVPKPEDAELRDELYYAACYKLYSKRYTDGAGRQTDMMSEFLMTYLLRDVLGKKLLQREFSEIAETELVMPEGITIDDDGEEGTEQ